MGSSDLARQHFCQEINQPDPQIDLAKAALYIAQEADPCLKIETYLHALDGMADEIREQLPAERYPLRVIHLINRYLFEDLGFRGNAQTYYDPRNSFLHEVIDRRVGIPITLSLVYMEIAKRLDFPMLGIGMPGHFLIRPDLPDIEIHVDPFHRGEILFPHDCEARLSQVYGQPVQLQTSFLEPVTPRRLLMRLLTNLKLIYLNQGNLERCVDCIDRILLLFPHMMTEIRDRGVLYHRAGHWTEARRDLQMYLSSWPEAGDAEVIRYLLQQMETN